MSKKFNTSSIAVAIFASLLVAGVLFVSANWQAPPKSPPACPASEPGCNAPINPGPSGQVIGGAFGVNRVFHVFGDGHLAGKVGIGTVSPVATLDVDGDINFNGQKSCRAFISGDWAESLFVPSSWTNANCQNYMKLAGASQYTLGCIFDNGTYSNGSAGSAVSLAGAPAPNCGW